MPAECTSSECLHGLCVAPQLADVIITIGDQDFHVQIKVNPDQRGM